MKFLRTSLLLLAGLAFTSPLLRAQIYTETVDAGPNVGLAQNTGATSGNPLNQIFGSLSSPTDADLYVIQILNPTLFSATTSGGPTTLDTALFLFAVGGQGIYTNDDASGASFQSTLPAGTSFTMSLAPGTYVLGVSLSGNEPVNNGSQLIFAGYISDNPTSVRGPAAGLNPNSVNDFNGNTTFAEMGAYRIDLTSAATSAAVVPEPSTYALCFLGALLLAFLLRKRRVLASSLVAVVVSGFLTAGVSAKPVPENLGYGLDKLVESDIAVRAAEARGKAAPATYNGYATPEAAKYAEMAIQNQEDGRFMVDITLNGKVPFAQLRDALTARFPSLEITAVDEKYQRVGVIEGWVSLEEAPALATTTGVQAVFLVHKPKLHAAKANERLADIEAGKLDPSAKPETNLTPLGSKFDQGVTQHRVDQINQYYNPNAPVNYDGQGITVGILSDSFNTRGSGSTAATAMATFDLPGAAGNPVNTQPVVVLDDPPGESDEGRGMAEIVYKMAPKAKLGFATAFGGEVRFANNIRALSGKFPSVPNTTPGFVADVITDDVSYGGEPVFTDTGIVMNAVDDVFAMGVSYFSSAANSYGVTVYNSDLRWVANGSGDTAATNAALVGTNISLANVPPALYQGGFHNFRADGGQDVACTWTVANGGAAIEVQWDDPYDNAPVIIQPPLYTNTGTLNDNSTIIYSDVPPLMAGQKYVISVTATSGDFDAIVQIIDPNDVVIIDQDTGTDEQVQFFPPVSGTYKIGVYRFATTAGNFRVDVNTSTGGPIMTTDINILTFRVDNGAYVPGSALVTNNAANNRPVELGATFGVGGQLQFVVARAFTPTAPRAATRIRLGTDANSNPNNAPVEYFDYNSAVTGGHSIAAGCNGVAAYDVFRPNVPQNFTSGGPALIYFDRNNNLIPNGPIVRLQPKFSAANNANTTWLTGDSANDVDTGGGQFGGTSASAPHAAGIAALVLQRHGGVGSVTPAQMTSLLQRSVFPHDLDPYRAVGVARATNGGKVTVSVRSDQTATAARGRNDPNSHAIAYIGPSSISSFVFNPNGLASEGGAVTSGRNGVDANTNYFSFVTPGMYFTNVTATGAFAFTHGAHSGLIAADMTGFALSNPAPAPANAAGQGQTLTLNFTAGTFTGGDVFRFTIGRGLTRGPNMTNANGLSVANYNADNFGGGVLIPEGTVIPDGMRFRGTLADGATFDGRMRNIIGFGFSQLDGFGFLNAEAAMSTPIQ